MLSRDEKSLCPGIEREMLSLVSAGLTLLPARRKGKERASMVSAAFYSARGGVHGQNGMGRSHWMKCIISSNGCARGVIVIVVGNEHGDTSSYLG